MCHNRIELLGLFNYVALSLIKWQFLSKAFVDIRKRLGFKWLRFVHFCWELIEVSVEEMFENARRIFNLFFEHHCIHLYAI